MSGAVKGLISLVVVGVMLYFVITSIQNLMQARSDVDLAQKQVDYWKGQTVIEDQFYASHGCTKSGETYICPAGTPDFVPTGVEPTK